MTRLLLITAIIGCVALSHWTIEAKKCEFYVDLYVDQYIKYLNLNNYACFLFQF